MKCGYHTIGVIYDTVKVKITPKYIGEVGSRHFTVSYITTHFYTVGTIY